MFIENAKILEYNERQEMNSLAFGVVIKHFHANSTIFDYKHRDIHLKFGISRPTYNKHIKTLLRNKDAFITGTSFVVRSLKPEGKKEARVYLNRLKFNNIKDIALELNSSLFMFNAESQLYVKNLKLLSYKKQDPSSIKEYRAAKKAQKKLDKLGYGMELADERTDEKEVSYSISGLVSLLGISQYSVYRVIKHLVSKGNISCRRDIGYIGRLFNKSCKSFKPSHNTFVSKLGNIYYCNSNIYTIYNTTTI